jgi:enoyl-[acyl-carrier-protein] reductase (NADH)
MISFPGSLFQKPHHVHLDLTRAIACGTGFRRVIESKAQAREMSIDQTHEELLRNVSLRTTVTPRQIADQIVFLCSPRGRTISGQAIAIDGDIQSLS